MKLHEGELKNIIVYVSLPIPRAWNEMIGWKKKWGERLIQIISENRRSFCNAGLKKGSFRKCAFIFNYGDVKKTSIEEKTEWWKKERSDYIWRLRACWEIRIPPYHLIRKLYGYPLYFDLNMERMREKKTAMMARPMKAWTRFLPPTSPPLDAPLDEPLEVESFFSLFSSGEPASMRMIIPTTTAQLMRATRYVSTTNWAWLLPWM